MNFHYDKKDDILAIRFSKNPYAESDEVQEGIIFDYDAKGKLIAIEILDASRRFPQKFRSSLKLASVLKKK